MAQETGGIRGRIATTDGQPVTDATVTVVGTRVRAQVDGEGRFTLPSITAGEALLDVTSVRHAGTVERVAVVAGETTQVDIVIVSRVHSEKIVVTASPRAHGELDLATLVNVLEGRNLAVRIEPTLGESLRHEAGISSTYFGPGASRPLIRGLGGDRIKVMENGIDVLDASSASPDHAVAADPIAAERIEVVRGPATLLYGSNAIGGVVNLLDQRIPHFARTQNFSGTVDVRAGSAADERAAAFDLDGGGDRWAWNLFLQSRQTDDYEIPGRASIDEHEEDEHEEEGHAEEEEIEGVLPNSDIDNMSGGVGASYFFGDRGFVGVSVRGFDTEYGLPGGHGHEEEGEHGEEEHKEEEHGEEDGHGEGDVRIDMQQRRYDFEGGISQPFGVFEKADFRVGIIDYEHVEGEGSEEGTAFLNDAWEARAEFVQKRRGSLSGSIGVQLRNRDFVVVGEEAFVPPAETESLGLFTFQEVVRGPLSYQFGARYENQQTSVQSDGLPDRDFDAFSASLGVVWRASRNYSLGASLARSVKLPTSEELYSEGPHFAVSAFEIGDPGLDEESALGLDLTLRKVEGRVTGSLNLFRNDFSDYIFQRFTGEEEDGLPVVQYSAADAEFWGAEVEASILLGETTHSNWGMDLLWDTVRAEFADGGDLPRIPPQRFGVGFHYRSDRLGAAAEARFVDDQDRIAENETPTEGYTMVNANVSYRFFFEKYFLDLILRGTNLMDEDARLHTSFVKNDVPLPGRNISLVARLGF
ncbi:MAG: TonB-dependent receptor [Acidobacteriota bacterium]